MIATVIGAIILLFTALGVVIQLKDAFNAAWEVDAKQLNDPPIPAVSPRR